MELNSDFSKRAEVHAAQLEWVPSPTAGVDRRMLDRIGGEVARATSIVRYAPNSRFPSHRHDAGEEFLVLEGVFQDEHGDFPEGSYIRNPPGSSHTPGSKDGCTIFVKLRQFDPADQTPVRLDTSRMRFDACPDRSGAEVVPLFQYGSEQVRLERYAPSTTVRLPAPGGLELLVLDGDFEESATRFTRLSWLRLPAGSIMTCTAGPNGCRVWMKTGHLG